MHFNHMTCFLIALKNYLNSSKKKCISSILSNLILYWQGAKICKKKQYVAPNERHTQHTKFNQL